MIKLWEIYLLKFKLFSFPQLLNVRLRIFLKSNLSLNMSIFVFIILIKFKKFKKIKMIKMIKLLLIKLNQLHLSNYFTFVWNLKLNRNWICCFHFWKVIANQNVLFSFLQENRLGMHSKLFVLWNLLKIYLNFMGNKIKINVQLSIFNLLKKNRQFYFALI